MIKVDRVNISIDDGESVAIVGENGSGKSVVADAIAAAYPDKVRYLKFRDSYGTVGDRDYYLQQRWNHGMWEDDEPLAGDMLEELVSRTAAVTGSRLTEDDSASGLFGDCDRRTRLDRLVTLFGLGGILEKRLITFSSGEMRKFQLTKVLMDAPQVLLADNPYIGLDSGTRGLLTELLKKLSEDGLTVILVLSRPDEIPDFIDSVVEVRDCVAVEKRTLEEYRAATFGPEIIRFRDVTVRYGDRTILKDVNWTVRKGEHWVLTGENGCGKSTLLSLVCADNPMAYACDIELFGHARGTGESIWEIKKKIGYVSPEMHRSYRQEEDALNVIASGLFDTVGLFYHVTPEQRETCRRWMEVFGISHLADKPFMRLSSGEQRLCLVCRAFVKNPPLLILDEPLHGLDDRYRTKVRSIIDDYCRDREKTLIMISHYPEEYPACIDHSLTLVRHS